MRKGRDEVEALRGARNVILVRWQHGVLRRKKNEKKSKNKNKNT